MENPCSNIYREPPQERMRMYLWGHMESQIYECHIENDVDSIARIAIVASGIRKMPVFANVHQCLGCRCEVCIKAGWLVFEQFLEECILNKFLLIKHFLKYRLSFLSWFLVEKYLLNSYHLHSHSMMNIARSQGFYTVKITGDTLHPLGVKSFSHRRHP